VLIGNLPWLDDVYMLLATDHASQVAKCKKEKVHPQPQKLRHSKKYVDIVQHALLPRVREVEPGKHT